MSADGYPHPRLRLLIERARAGARAGAPSIGMVYPCDAHALQAAVAVAEQGIARPVLVGPRALIESIAEQQRLDIGSFELMDSLSHEDPVQQARQAAVLAARTAADGALDALMKGSLHTDELMSAVIRPANGLRQGARISHAFVFDLPRYHKLLALADCVVNISPSLRTKRDILGNAIGMLTRIGIEAPKVGIVAAVETVNPAIPATVDAAELVELARQGEWPGATVEGPFGFDNVISAESARIKKMDSQIAGDPDLLIMPDLNAGNILYKAFNYIGGGECAGLVLGAKVPIVLTSRSDSQLARVASAALAALYRNAGAPDPV